MAFFSERDTPEQRKLRHFWIGLILDVLGMFSFVIPGVGEFSDVIWAPIAAFCMTRMYQGNLGKIAAGIAFLEEALPFLDFIPTFTLTWWYNYYIKAPKSL